VVTISDIAVRCGTGPDVIDQLRAQYGFPRPLTPAASGSLTWWWPDVWEFIDQRKAVLAGTLPLIAATPPSAAAG
jgi:hypothetical protein